jgi:ubiquitin-protein ligase
VSPSWRRYALKQQVVTSSAPLSDNLPSAPPQNLYDFYALLQGPDGTVYEGGFYVAKLRFPQEYPFKPPSVLMLTPSGRFAVNTRLCLSMSDFHPETWNPMWTVGAILTGLLSFMTGSDTTTGSVQTTDADKRALAAASVEWNLGNPQIKALFPDLREIAEEAAVKRQQAATAPVDSAAARRRELFGDAERDGGSEQHEAVRLATEALCSAAPDAAVSTLRTALSNVHDDHGDSAALVRLLLHAYLALGEFDAAMEAMEGHAQALATWPHVASLRACCTVASSAKRDGNAAFAAQRFSDAAACYTAGGEAVVAATGVSCALFSANLAAVAAATHDTAAAVAHARAALAVHGGHVKARRRLADGLSSLGEWEEAASHYVALLELFPTDAGLKAQADTARSKAAVEE